MKLFSLVVAGVLFLSGWIHDLTVGSWMGPVVGTSGATLFIMQEAFGLFRISKTIATAEPDDKHRKFENVAGFFRNMVIVAAFASLVTGQLYGGIILGGMLLLYIVAGVVLRIVTGIPLRMSGYGSWYVKGVKRGRARRGPVRGTYVRRAYIRRGRRR